MKSNLLRLYHALPIALRTPLASVHGHSLRRWRYGPETDRWIEEAHMREKWPAERWQSWQDERLAYMLDHAATRVPYYRRRWEERRRLGDRASWHYIENWPILEKTTVREYASAFVADGYDIRRMSHIHTSGTTGQPLNLWWDKQTMRAYYAILEARTKRRDRPWASLGGQLVTPTRQCKPPFWVWNAALSQLYMSSYHLAPDWIPFYLDALKQYNIRFMYAYTSSLYSIAQETIQVGRRDVSMDVVFTNAEPVYDFQRDVISKAFQCPVRETYGMAEGVAAASECEAGRLHLWPEVGVVEVIEGLRAVPDGDAGDLVCTGLFREEMPLIRYRVGDRGTMPAREEPCVCGRTTPVLHAVEGRSDDVLFTQDGRKIGRLDTVFKAELPIREAQVIQESLGQVRVRYVPLPDFQNQHKSIIRDQLRGRMGDIMVLMEETDEIPKGPNGKFKAVVCNLMFDELPS